MFDAASIFEIQFEKYSLKRVVESFSILMTHSESVQLYTVSKLPTDASTNNFNSIAFAAAVSSSLGMEL